MSGSKGLKSKVYGFRDHKWIRAEGPHEEYYYARVPNNFKCKYITGWASRWRDNYYCEGFMGHVISWYHVEREDELPECENIETSCPSRYGLTPLPYENPELYELIDMLLDTNNELGLECELDSDYDHDEVITLMGALCTQATDQHRRLDLLKGKDIYTLITDLDAAKIQLTKANEAITQQTHERADLVEELTKTNARNVLLTHQLNEAKAEVQRLMTEREGHKKEVIAKLQEAISKM